MTDIRYGFEELQRENTLLREEIGVLQNEIGIVAKSRIMPMEQKIGALEDAYNTAKLSRRAKYVQGLADTFTKLGMPEKAAALLEAHGARTAAGNHTAAGNSNNSF